jgi:multicomponent Na+:H+ antiporter subunit G
MNILIIILLFIGLLFFTGGTLGILRFPDFYSRLHPAGKVDTLATLFMTIAVALYTVTELSFLNLILGLKIIFIAVFAYLAIPTATHALINAGLRAGLEPWTKEEKKEE